MSSLSSVPTTDAVCQPGFEWATNDKGQSPCLLAAYLEGACGSGYWHVPALPTGNRYNAPNANQTDVCICSTVTYNAVSLCGNCQGASYVTWPAWKLNCIAADVSVAEYRMEIPKNTSIPRWAYQDPTQMSTSSLNVTLAKQVALQDDPDVTTSTSNSNITSSAGPNIPQSSGSTLNVGAIAGSVVGGVTILAIAAVLLFWLIKKRRSTRASSAPSKQYINKWSKGVVGAAPVLGGTSRWDASSQSGSVWGTKEGREAGSPSPYMIQNPATASTPIGHSYPKNGIYTGTPIVSEPQHSPPSSYPYPYSQQQRLSPSPQMAMAPTASSAGDHSINSRHNKDYRPSKKVQNQITPFILPPVTPSNALDGTYDSQEQPPAWSQNLGYPKPLYASPAQQSSAIASLGHGYAPSTGSRGRSGSNSSSNMPPPFLPTTVEYPKEKQSMQAFANSNPGYAFGGARDTAANRYYNPDDPSTFPPVVGTVSSRSRRSSGDKDRTRGSAEKNMPPSSFYPHMPSQKPQMPYGYDNKSRGSLEEREKDLAIVTSGLGVGAMGHGGYLTGNESLHTLPNASPVNGSSNALGLGANNNSNPNHIPYNVEPQPQPSIRAFSPSSAASHQQHHHQATPLDVASPRTAGSGGSVVPLLTNWGKRIGGNAHPQKKNGSGDTTSTTQLWSPYTPSPVDQQQQPPQQFDPYRGGRF